MFSAVDLVHGCCGEISIRFHFNAAIIIYSLFVQQILKKKTTKAMSTSAAMKKEYNADADSHEEQQPINEAKTKKRLCKALNCQKWKQAKCNGYCMACFQQLGAVTCRDWNCVDKIHKEGYCVSHQHLASAVDDTKATKPAPKKIAASKPEPSKPAQSSAKKKRPYRERLTFPKTSVNKKLRVEASSKIPEHQTITKTDLQSLFRSVLNETRHAKANNGKIYYLLDEIRDNINKALDASSSVGHKGKKEATKIDEATDESQGKKEAIKVDEAPIEVQGISDEAFTADEIASMPVVYAYNCGDPESEQNAKIATLDYEVEQNRLKRKAAMSERKLSSVQEACKPKATSPQGKSVGSMEDEAEIVPADEFPTGWTMQNVPRKNSKSKRPFDTYYYSPELKLKFRSRPEVKRFIELLESSDNDEMKAKAKFTRR